MKEKKGGKIKKERFFLFISGPNCKKEKKKNKRKRKKKKKEEKEKRKKKIYFGTKL